MWLFGKSRWENRSTSQPRRVASRAPIFTHNSTTTPTNLSLHFTSKGTRAHKCSCELVIKASTFIAPLDHPQAQHHQPKERTRRPCRPHPLTRVATRRPRRAHQQQAARLRAKHSAHRSLHPSRWQAKRLSPSRPHPSGIRALQSTHHSALRRVIAIL